MDGMSLIMPMAGRGTRFQRNGYAVPKPLIELFGRPLFHWSVESLAQAFPLRETVFVVLAEHVRQFEIDERIRVFYPRAQVVVVSEPTAGAAETAALGVAALTQPGPFAVNDCDHSFAVGEGIDIIIKGLRSGAAGALLGFAATSPAYSYVLFDAGRVIGTVEKRVASPFAIAGCYLFADPQHFMRQFKAYRWECPYDELFLSGIYNALIREGSTVLFHELAHHVSFGTPEELARVQQEDLAFLNHLYGPT